MDILQSPTLAQKTQWVVRPSSKGGTLEKMTAQSPFASQVLPWADSQKQQIRENLPENLREPEAI